jgi:hypothetical protein
MSVEDPHRAIDAESNIQASFRIVQGSDGGASAVTIELTNTSRSDEVVLKVNTALSAFITITVTDDQGAVLSKPARKFSSAEQQSFELVRLAPGASQRWRVPLAEQLDASAIPAGSLKGRLVINVLLLYRKSGQGEQPSGTEFKSSVMTLSDMDVRFTRVALNEGEWAPRNGH